MVDEPKTDNKRVAISNPSARNVKPRGTSGTQIYAGYFNEEYLQALMDQDGICKYDEMRRTDGQVKMLLSVIKNPIKSASWKAEPAGDEDIDQEIADFVNYALFEKMGTSSGSKRKTFREFISESLTMIDFGYVVFEKVHKLVIADKKYGDFIGYSDLGFRHQRSILEWKLDLDGAIEEIRQLVDGDLKADVMINGKFLLVMSMDKEGDNYQGISMLRACYRSWFLKNLFLKLQGIGIERASKGVPVGTVPAEAIQSEDYQQQLDDFQAILDKLGAHETNGIVLPAGFDIQDLKISHDPEKVQKAIDACDMQMAKAFLANFMELGNGGNGGSYALGSDLSDIFLSGIQYIADGIAEKIDMELIPDIVRAKFGEQDSYPKMKVMGINDKAGKELAEIVSKLLKVGGMQESVKLQKHMHARYKISDIDEDIAEIKDEKDKNPDPEPEDEANENPKEKDEEDIKKKQLSDCCNRSYMLADADRKAFPVSAMIEDEASVLNELMRLNLKLRSESMLNDVQAIIRKGGSKVRKKVLSTRLPQSKAYNTALTEFTSNLIESTFDKTVAEVGVNSSGFKLADDLKKAPKELRDKLTALILLTSGVQEDDIEKAVHFTFNDNFDTLSDDDLVKEIDRQVDAYFAKKVIDTTSVNMTSNIVNSTRHETFLDPQVFEEVESFVFNNPDPKSLICKELNGRVFSKEEFETTLFDPPLHHNCKSYISVQTKGVSTNKPITGLKITGTAEEKEKILRSKTL